MPFKGGDDIPHSSSNDHIEETKPGIHDIPSSEDHQTSESYSIVCDRPCKTIRKPTRYSADNEDGLIAYTLVVAQEVLEGIEPSTYSEASSCPNFYNWLLAM